MPITVSQEPHDYNHQAFENNNNITYKELHGHAEGDGLSCGIISVTGESETAFRHPYGSTGIVIEGTLVLVDCEFNTSHTLTAGHTFNTKKETIFKWGNGSNGKAFYTMAKPLGEAIPSNITANNY